MRVIKRVNEWNTSHILLYITGSKKESFSVPSMTSSFSSSTGSPGLLNSSCLCFSHAHICRPDMLCSSMNREITLAVEALIAWILFDTVLNRLHGALLNVFYPPELRFFGNECYRQSEMLSILLALWPCRNPYCVDVVWCYAEFWSPSSCRLQEVLHTILSAG